MFNNYFKHLRVRMLSAGFGTMLSMLVTLLGLMPQPVAAYSGLTAVPFDLIVARHGHTATTLADGRILIVGGEDSAGAALNQAEIINPFLTSPTSSAGYSQSRTEHTTTRLNDGRVLVIGGRAGASILGSSEFFDPVANEWSPGPNMTNPRYGHSATLLANGDVLVVGGDANGSAEMYDSNTGTFSTITTGQLNTARSKHSAVLLKDGKVENNGKVLIVGGQGDNETGLQSAELFDPVAGIFSTVDSAMSSARVKPDLRVLQDGKVQVIGGNNTGTFELFDPDLNNTKPGFNAVAQPANNSLNALATINTSDTLNDPLELALNAQTRFSLLFEGSAISAALEDITNRTGFAMAEAPQQPLADGTPQATKVVIAGGKLAGQALSSAYVLDGSPATITTNATDYAPGNDVLVNGSGWKPGEEVEISWQKVKAGTAPANSTPFTWIANSAGKLDNLLIYTPVAPTDVDATFTLTAVGLMSGFVAQTGFTDAGNNSLTVTVTGGGSVSSTPTGITSCTSAGGACTKNYSPDTSVTLTVTPASGFTFTGWGGRVPALEPAQS